MKRREFITLLGSGAVVWPLVARAQQPERMRRIGILMAYPENDAAYQGYVMAFREELQKLGWQEGRNVRFDYRWATSDLELIKRSAKELIALQPDLILSSSTPSTASLLQQTQTIPIIFANIIDPVASGFVASLSRPGGNSTGYVILEPSMASKWPELLKEIAPRVNRIAILYHPATTAPFVEAFLKPLKAAAASFGVEAILAPINDSSELEPVIAAQAREPNGGLVAMPDLFLVGHRVEVTSLAARHRLPALYNYRSFTEAGGLMSYGNDPRAKPADLPVMQPTKFELVINLKTAKALGIAVPPTLLARADEVIE